MKTLYAIRDRIANDLVSMQMYTLFNFKTDEQAARYFADSVLDEKSILNKHPGDYELIKIADINDSGDIISEHGPKIVITGAALTPTKDT